MNQALLWQPGSKYAICETIAAYKWHIRRLNGRSPMFSGLPAHPETLCGLKAAWDINVNVDDKARRPGCCCRKCAEAYIREHDGGAR